MELTKNIISNSKIIKSAIFVLIGTALLAMSSKIQTPFTLVPATMQTFVVMFLGIILGYKLATLTVILYLIEGSFGLPVFASAPYSGPAYFFGPSGGYLFGMLCASFFVGFMAEKNFDKNYFKTLIILLIGSVIIFVPGILWLGFWFNILSPNADSLDIYQSYSNALNFGLLLYKFTEPVKIALAATITPLVWQYLKNK